MAPPSKRNIALVARLIRRSSGTCASNDLKALSTLHRISFSPGIHILRDICITPGFTMGPVQYLITSPQPVMESLVEDSMVPTTRSTVLPHGL